MSYDDPITSVRGVGDAIAQKLKKIGIETVGDLIEYYPRKYDDYSRVDTISVLRPGIVTIKAKFKQVTARYARRGLHITEAIASDETGSVRVIWFNQPYRATGIDSTKEYYIRGEFALRHQRLSIMSPTVELVSDFPAHSARILPSYRLTKGVTSVQIRKMIHELAPEIQQLPETLPTWLVKEEGLISKAQAMYNLHFPKNDNDIKIAEHRLGLEEVFQLGLAALLNKNANTVQDSTYIPFDEGIAKRFTESLPFTLTASQRKVIWQIYRDFEKPHPMNRLLEGDVGSGKTIVACMAALMVVAAGKQVAFMAPTEILARQHAETLVKLLTAVKMQDTVILLLGSMTKAQKQRANTAITEGRSKLIVGTTSLIQEKINMHSLALVVVDEQHRFGVDQRKKLQSKADRMPHVLSMTATPIPRSLALTLYGELDISILNEKPSERSAVTTSLVSPNSTRQMYENTQQQLRQGRQAFVVCPVIVESDDDSRLSVTATYESLRHGEFKDWRVGLLHGQMASDEKDKIMRLFSEGSIDVLVTTTVIEVGVDIPNATVMIIQAPERFGLAQIHQLRGRIGRSTYEGFCYLVLSDSTAPSRRLKALESIHDGFLLAELDLEIRGPGAIYGTLQHGAIDLRIAKLTDTMLITAARNAAKEFIDRGENIDKYPVLQEHVNRLRTVTNLN